MKLAVLVPCTALLLGNLVAPGSALAAPLTLGGMGITSQWTDLETTSGEVPASPWGNSSALNANRVGIYVEYANGLTGSATYSGVAGFWGGCCNIGIPNGISPDSESGFFASSQPNYANLHGLDNTSTFSLPMAFTTLANQFTSNFDLSRENQGNSTWRADVGGWQSVTITLYSSTASVTSAIPEPDTLALAGLALAGIAALRRRRA